jgi:peroxiredoxin
MLALGTKSPDFSLPNFNGKPSQVSLRDYGGRPLLVMFLCNHCPYVIHIKERLAELGGILEKKGIGVVAINSNDIATHPDDSPDLMASEAKKSGYTFPYLFDETQKVAQAYRAACTPDFFLFDQGHRLVYRGQFDDSRPGNSQPVTGRDLLSAVELLLSGAPIPEAAQKASLGCNIKWRAGNEPGYFGA